MVVGKRQFVAGTKALIFDVEGTTTSISFVKDKLFPYIRDNLKEFVERHWSDEEFKETRALLKGMAVDSTLEGAVVIPDEGTDEEIQEAVVKSVLWQMDQDIKAMPLKTIQGHILREGYKQGQLKGHIYPDVVPCLRAWAQSGLKLFVYSSGSVEAQKLLFGYSQEGDVLELFEGHFDTNVGRKVDSQSYADIVKQLDYQPDEVVFFTDIPVEATAAVEAGLTAVLVAREGNAELSDDVQSRFQVIRTFDDFECELPSKRRKVSAEVDGAAVEGESHEELPSAAVEDVDMEEVKTVAHKTETVKDEEMAEEATPVIKEAVMEEMPTVAGETALGVEKVEIKEALMEVDASKEDKPTKVAVENVEPVVAELAEAAKETATEVVEAAKETGTEVVEAAKETATEIVEAAKETATEVVEAAKEIATEVVEATKETGTEVVEAAKETATEVVEAAKETATEVVEAAKETATEIVEAAKETAAEVVEAAKETATEVVEAAKETATEVVEAAKETATEVVEAAKETATEVVEAAKETATEVVEAAKETATELVEAAKETGTEVVEAAKETGTEVVEDAKETTGEAVEAVPVKETLVDKVEAVESVDEKKGDKVSVSDEPKGVEKEAENVVPSEAVASDVEKGQGDGPHVNAGADAEEKVPIVIKAAETDAVETAAAATEL